MTNGKLAIVTGGTQGIGLAISKALIADGFDVAAIYVGSDDAAVAFKEAGGKKAVNADVSNYEACQKAVSEIEAELGGTAVLVNNAGITRDNFLHKMTLEQWSAVINVNLSSSFNTAKAVIPGMRERGFGRIVSISSINGEKGQMGQTNYSAAKAGLLGFTKALAQESARKGITVNAICPGYVATDMTKSMPEKVLESIVGEIPIGRLGEPSEIAALVAFLASDKASFITGATLSANGGQYM